MIENAISQELHKKFFVRQNHFYYFIFSGPWEFQKIDSTHFLFPPIKKNNSLK